VRLTLVNEQLNIQLTYRRDETTTFTISSVDKHVVYPMHYDEHIAYKTINFTDRQTHKQIRLMALFPGKPG